MLALAAVAIAHTPDHAAAEYTPLSHVRLAPVSAASAQEADGKRLEAWLEHLARRGKGSRRFSGISGLITGPALVGLGFWVALDQDRFDGSYQALGATALIGMGATNIGRSLFSLSQLGEAERRYVRFQRARAGGLTARELGRFEGELKGLAEQAKAARYASIVSGFAGALGGGAVLLATGLSDMPSDQERFGWIAGGIITGLGLLGGTFSWIFRSGPERVWQRYRDGQSPRGHRAHQARSFQLTPTVLSGAGAVAGSGTSIGGGGLRIAGTF